MSISTFLVRPKLIKDESLTSYIQRIATANHVKPHDVWRLLIKPYSHYPQSSLSTSLDIYPNSMIDINKLGEMLYLKKDLIEHLTFSKVFKKFGVEEKKVANSRILSGLINKHRKYCPNCLSENLYYKLIWQIKEIHFCDKHNVFLNDFCWKCHNKIPLLPNNEIIGYCPYCNANLTEAPLKPYKIEIQDKRVLEDWMYLLYANNKISCIKNLTIQQTIAFKLLYIINNFSKTEINIPSHLKQTARNTRTLNTFTHLKFILDTIRSLNISMDIFFKIIPDSNFIESFLAEKLPLHKQYSCLAPWCQGYKNPGTLERTSTSVHKMKDGKKYKYYMYCTKCGLEYCVDSDTNEIIERGYFIKLGWNKILPVLKDNMSIKEIAKIFKTTEDKVKRCIIFMASNGLIRNKDLPLEIPYSHNKKTINQIKSLISQGVPSKEIRKKINLTYNSFLYYWFLSEIYIEHIKHITSKPSHKSNYEKYNKEFEATINYFLKNDIDITIKNVSSHLNICPETLRYRGFLSKLKKAKEKQKNMRKEKNRIILKLKAKNYILNAKISGKKLKSEDIYNHLGVRRTVIVRSYPDVTNYIYNLMKKEI